MAIVEIELGKWPKLIGAFKAFDRRYMYVSEMLRDITGQQVDFTNGKTGLRYMVTFHSAEDALAFTLKWK